MQMSLNAYEAPPPSGESANVDPKLEENLKSLQPSDVVLVYVDIELG